MKKLFFISFICLGYSAISFSQIKVLTNGNVGIGTFTPNNKIQVAGFIYFNDSYYNTFIGKNSGSTTSTGSSNTFYGSYSGAYINTGSCNTFIGGSSGMNNSNGGYNTFVGNQTGLANTTGTNNTFTGYQSGRANTTQSNNTFYGNQSGKVNYGSNNTFIGTYSGIANTSADYNTFLGHGSGYINTTGLENTFLGYTAGRYNTSATYNTFVGSSTGYYNTGSENTFTGYKAGYYNTTGSHNTFYGDFAGSYNTITGSNNTCIGYHADLDSIGRFNATALGNGAIAQKNNAIYLGNTATNGVYAYGGYHNISDGRFKINVQENVKGLEFINKLRPVTYQMNIQELDNFIIQNMSDSMKTVHQTGMDFISSSGKIRSGFIAQEVEIAEIESGFTSTIVSKPNNSNDPYSLSYEELVVPLVKAVQELSATVEQQKLEIQELKARLDECCKTSTPGTIIH